MAVNYVAAAKTARMQAVADLLGAGCRLVLGASSLSGATGVLASVEMATKPTVATDTLTLQGLPISVNATAGGTLARAELRKSDGTVVVSGLTVGTADTDIVVSAVALASGQQFTLNSGTLKHAS